MRMKVDYIWESGNDSSYGIGCRVGELAVVYLWDRAVVVVVVKKTYIAQLGLRSDSLMINHFTHKKRIYNSGYETSDRSGNRFKKY